MTRAILLPVGRDWFALPPVALQEVVADPKNHTRDLGGTASTQQVGDAVVGRLG